MLDVYLEEGWTTESRPYHLYIAFPEDAPKGTRAKWLICRFPDDTPYGCNCVFVRQGDGTYTGHYVEAGRVYETKPGMTEREGGFLPWVVTEGTRESLTKTSTKLPEDHDPLQQVLDETQELA